MVNFKYLGVAFTIVGKQKFKSVASIIDNAQQFSSSSILILGSGEVGKRKNQTRYPQYGFRAFSRPWS